MFTSLPAINSFLYYSYLFINFLLGGVEWSRKYHRYVVSHELPLFWGELRCDERNCRVDIGYKIREGQRGLVMIVSRITMDFTQLYVIHRLRNRRKGANTSNNFPLIANMS